MIAEIESRMKKLMQRTRERVPELRKRVSSVRFQAAEHQAQRALEESVTSQVAHRRTHTNSEGLMSADWLRLQRQVGNRAVQDLVQRRWSDADPNAYPAPKDPSQLPTPPGGWNAANRMVGRVERIPLEGLKEGLQAGTERTKAEKTAEKARATQEAENAKAIAVVPALKAGQPVEILLHLHGHNEGYRQLSSAKDGMAPGSVRDVAADRIEQQIEASGRNMIAILPQGTMRSGFGPFDPKAYILEVWGKLRVMNKLPKGATLGPVILSGHSGAAAPINRMLASGNLPMNLGELVLFDAIHSGQRRDVEEFLAARMADDLQKLREIANLTFNGGIDETAVKDKQKAHLSQSFRFRGIYTPKFHPQKKDEHGNKMWLDPDTKKKPMLDESVWEGYGVQYEPLAAFIKSWIDRNTKGLDRSVVTALRQNYQVIPAGRGATHSKIMGANNNLQSAIGALPSPAAAPAPKQAPATPGAAPKTGALESTPDAGPAAELASRGTVPPESEPAPVGVESGQPIEETPMEARV